MKSNGDVTYVAKNPINLRKLQKWSSLRIWYRTNLVSEKSFGFVTHWSLPILANSTNPANPSQSCLPAMGSLSFGKNPTPRILQAESFFSFVTLRGPPPYLANEKIPNKSRKLWNIWLISDWNIFCVVLTRRRVLLRKEAERRKIIQVWWLLLLSLGVVKQSSKANPKYHQDSGFLIQDSL